MWQYRRAQHARLKGRRGPRKPTIEVGHSILVAAYHMPNRNEALIDLRADYFRRHDPEGHANRLVRQLKALGYQVNIQPVQPPGAKGHFHQRLAACTGARQRQLLALRWGDIDGERAAIAFSGGLAVGPKGLELPSMKNHRTYRWNSIHRHWPKSRFQW